MEKPRGSETSAPELYLYLESSRVLPFLSALGLFWFASRHHTEMYFEF